MENETITFSVLDAVETLTHNHEITEIFGDWKKVYGSQNIYRTTLL